jgi:2',3'-cyclic-nucleotide 2'-phosphodiesterase (5'-nucleotidase family)
MNQRRTITLLQMNDTHGYLEPHPELFWAGAQAEYRTAGGYARLLTNFKRVRQERNGAVIGDRRLIQRGRHESQQKTLL